MSYSGLKFYLRPQAASRAAKPTASLSPSSEAPKPNPASSPDTANAKDSRAWTHDRQRTKRAEMRARKAQWTPRADNVKRSSGPRWSLDRDEVRVFEDVPAAVVEDDHGAQYAELGSRLEVPLAALVTSRKSRRKGKDGDFEFVPSVRSVIALDDNVIPDLDVDEPWEHVNGDDTDDLPSVSKGPSYAAVASLS